MYLQYPLLNLSKTPIWNGNLCELKCVNVVPETHDVSTFYFKPKRIDGALFSYLPGQFITFQLVIEGKSINRTYTISSSPTRPYILSVTIKKHPNGLVSNWMHQNIKKGVVVEVLGPAGDFSFIKTPSWNKKYLFLSGGSGITPMLSMSRCLTDMKTNADIAFVHNARSSQDLIAHQELSYLDYYNRQFSLTYICDIALKNWTGLTGYLTIEKLQKVVPDFKERETFVCGPALYMKAVKEMLDKNGYDMERYHSESFDFFELTEPGNQIAPRQEAVNQENVQSSTGEFTIELKRFGKISRFHASGKMNILQSLRNQGTILPFGCQEGICGSCKTLKTSGAVKMQAQGGILEREEEEGYILLCCSYPKSDITIEVD